MNVFAKYKGCLQTLLLAAAIALTGSQTLWAQSWKCGVDVNATLEDGTLKISGAGRMTDYFTTATPWYDYRNSINSVVIGRGVTSIGDFAFYNLTEMTSITIPYGITSIGNSAFFKCARFTDIDLPNSLRSIGTSAFMECAGLTSVVIPDGVTEIPINAFSGCGGLTSVAIPNNVTKIGINAFGGCRGLTSVIIPYGVTTIAMNTFGGCTGLTEITIPNSVTSIQGMAFEGCTGLTSFKIPDGVTTVKTGTLNGCTGLASVIIPQNVTTIESLPFDGCTSLRSIISLNPSPPAINSATFPTTNNICLYVPYSSIATYESANYWKNFSCIKSTDEYVSVAARNSIVPAVGFDGGAATVAPVNRLTAEFTAGPNPVSRSSGAVSFFRHGSRVAYATLSIYDASGSVIRKIRVIDDAVGSQTTRKVSSWNLRDAKGRLVPEGTYLVKGVLKTSGGKRERVSVVVGVK